jgi:very-short-patch-repair endonuclease
LTFSERRVFFEDIIGTTKKINTGSYHNINEAKKTIQLLNRIVKKETKFSVGVVTPFRGQANLIRRLINEDFELSKGLSKRSFICDTVHKFQGDERDVVIYNSVISGNSTDSMIWFLNNSPELFNVAITRARSYFIFVGDKQECLKSKIPYYKNYIEYVKNLIESDIIDPVKHVKPSLPFESKWEEILYHYLIEEGYRPIMQYSIINYRLDFALFIGNRKINIEVDGEMYHKDWTGARLKQDLIRDRRLNDLEWEILRFWVYELKDDMTGCLERIKNLIETESHNYVVKNHS